MIRQDVKVVRIIPQHMLIDLENRLIRQLEHEMTLADNFVLIGATTQRNPMKKLHIDHLGRPTVQPARKETKRIRRRGPWRRKC